MIRQAHPAHYMEFTYDTRERFVSYWHQIDEIATLKPNNVLEVGKGNGFVSRYLKEREMDVTTLDIDKLLLPDVVGSAVNMPFSDDSFDIVASYEVLEHLPYESFGRALAEMWRVCRRYTILSLPDTSRYILFSMRLPKIDKYAKVLVSLPRIRSAVHNSDREHYWEIGKHRYPTARIVRDIQKVGFRVEKTYRVFENPYHRFFLLRKLNHECRESLDETRNTAHGTL